MSVGCEKDGRKEGHTAIGIEEPDETVFMPTDYHAFHTFSATRRTGGDLVCFQAARGIDANTCAFQADTSGHDRIYAGVHRAIIGLIACHANDLLASSGVEDEHRGVIVADYEVVASSRQWRDACRAGFVLFTCAGSIDRMHERIAERRIARDTRLRARWEVAAACNTVSSAATDTSSTPSSR